MNIQTDFWLGQIVATAYVNDLMIKKRAFKDFCMECLCRHLVRDWGDLCEEDKKLNDVAFTTGERILSSYIYPSDNSNSIWIITEADRSVTTILFPYEY